MHSLQTSSFFPTGKVAVWKNHTVKRWITCVKHIQCFLLCEADALQAAGPLCLGPFWSLSGSPAGLAQGSERREFPGYRDWLAVKKGPPTSTGCRLARRPPQSDGGELGRRQRKELVRSLPLEFMDWKCNCELDLTSRKGFHGLGFKFHAVCVNSNSVK